MTSPPDTSSTESPVPDLDVPDAERPPSRQAKRRRGNPFARLIADHTGRLLPVAIVAGCLAWLWALQSYWWFADDFLYLSQSKGATPDVDFLTVSNYGHFAPVTRFAYWIAANPLGSSHAWASIMSVIPLGIALFLASLIIKELAPERPTLRWLVLLPLGSQFMFRVVPWWGASIHVLVGLVWSHLALYSWIRHLRTNSVKWQVAAYGALVGGLLTQERPMFVVGACFLVQFLATPGTGEWHVFPLDWKRELRRWVPFVVIVLVGIWNQLTNYPNEVPPPAKKELVKYVYYAFVDYFLPGLFSARGGPVSFPALLVRWGALALLAVLIVDVLRRRQHWWKAPLFFAATWIVHVGIVGAVKAGVMGAEGVARDGQYYIDATFLSMFAFAIALSQPLKATAEGGPVPLVSWQLRRRVVAAGLLVLVTVANVPGTATRMRAEIPGMLSGREYWAKASTAFELPEGSDERFLPLRLPAVVAPNFVAPANEQAEVRRLFLDDERLMDGRGDRLVAVDRDGLLREIAPEVLESGNLGARALEGRAMTSGPVLEHDDAELCFDPASTGGTVDLTLQTPLPAPRWPWNNGPAYDIPTYFAVRYYSAAAGPIGAGSVVDDSLDFITHPLSVVEGTGIAIARIDNDGIAPRVFLTGFAGRRACVSDYAVFHAVALPLTPGSPCDRLGLGGEYEHGVPCPTTRWDADDVIEVGGSLDGG